MAKKDLRKSFTLIGCLIPILVVIIIGSSVAVLAAKAVSVSPRSITVAQRSIPIEYIYTLSGEQQDIVSQFGYPDAFTIFFYEEAQDDASLQDFRLEIWTYNRTGKEITILNGKLVEQTEIEPAAASLLPMPYHPEQFASGMDATAVVSAANLGEYIRAPLDIEETEIDGGTLLFGQQIVFGFQGDDLRYVESFALESEGLE